MRSPVIAIFLFSTLALRGQANQLCAGVRLVTDDTMARRIIHSES